MKTGFLFPGQGAQTVGMGKDFFEKYTSSRMIYQQADDILSMSLSKLCFEGTLEELSRTDVSQPAILTTSIAVLEAMREEGVLEKMKIEGTAGLSLGEYTALIFAGVLSFEDALKVVRQRGIYMQESCDMTKSAMTSIIGLTKEDIVELCEELEKEGIICIANLNSPCQIAVSGEEKLVKKISILAKKRGAKKVIRLNVAGAFHSPLMNLAAEKLQYDLEKIKFSKPSIVFVSNVTGKEENEPDVIRLLLAKQVISPVRWEDSMRYFISNNFIKFYEIGPGRVLAGLMKRIDSNVTVINIRTNDDLEEIIK